MKWSEVSDSEKTRLIIEHVLKFPIFEKQPKMPLPVPLPIAFDDGMSELGFWQIWLDGDDPTTFCPWRSLVDAWWLVVDYLPHATVEIHHVPQAYNRCIIKPYEHDGVPIEVTTDRVIDTICIAVLRYYGVEVEP